FSLVVSNTPTPLVGLTSFSLRAAPLQIVRQGDQFVLRWSAGDGTVYYEVESASDLGSPGNWRAAGFSPTLDVQRWSGGLGSSWRADWVATNALSGPVVFYRIKLLNP